MHNYSSTLKTMGFLYLETKKSAALMLSGEDAGEIMRQSVEDNIFLMKTETRKREVASTIISRLSVLDEYYIEKIARGNLGVSKLVVLLSIIKTDRLFYEFMHDVYSEKLIIMDDTITGRDFTSFFQRKSEQSEKVARWTDYTHYKLGQVYRKIFIEAGIVRAEANKLLIIRPVLEKELTEHIKASGDQHYLNAMIGGR